MLWVLLVAILGGAVPTLTKISLTVFPPFTFIVLRFVTAFLVLFPMLIKSREKLSRRDIRLIVLVSLFGTGNVVFFAFGVKLTTATVSQLLYAAVPIIASILSAIILKSRISKVQIAGVLIGFAGVSTIFLGSGTDLSSASGTMMGNTLIMMAVISYSLYSVFSKKTQERASPLALTTIMVITTIIIDSLLIATEIPQYRYIPEKITFLSIIGVVYVGLIGTAFYILIYQKVMEKASPLFASMIFYLQPIFTYICSVILLNERLTASIITGSVLSLAGAGLVTRKEPDKPQG